MDIRPTGQHDPQAGRRGQSTQLLQGVLPAPEVAEHAQVASGLKALIVEVVHDEDASLSYTKTLPLAVIWVIAIWDGL